MVFLSLLQFFFSGSRLDFIYKVGLELLACHRNLTPKASVHEQLSGAIAVVSGVVR